MSEQRDWERIARDFPKQARDWHNMMRCIDQCSPPRDEKRAESERSAALESALQAWRME